MENYKKLINMLKENGWEIINETKGVNFIFHTFAKEDRSLIIQKWFNADAFSVYLGVNDLRFEKVWASIKAHEKRD